MSFSLFNLTFTLILITLIAKFLLKPLYYIFLYTKNKGVARFTFVPILGPFAFLDSDLKKHGDCFHRAKRAYQIHGQETRAIAYNLADRAALAILDPELIRDYFVNKDFHYVKYDRTYKNKSRIFGNGVAFAEGKQWKRRRTITTSLMNFQFFEDILPKIRQIILKIFSQFVDNKFQFDAFQLSSRIAGDTIVKCFFGTDIHNTKFHGQPISLALSKFVSEVGDLDSEFLILLLGPKILNLGLTKKHRKINQKIIEMRAFGKELVYSKIQSAERQTEMNFIKFIKQKGYLDLKNQVHLTSDQLLDEFFTFFIGGMDTTAHLLHMCLYYLSIHPQFQERLRTQTKTVSVNATIPQLNKLVFLQNFINESIRHYGFITSFFPREAIKDHMLGDIKIYKGTLISAGWLENNNSSKYFQNPTSFDPDRWNKPLQSSYIFTPFSAGRRNCIGKNIALIEIKLVLINILKQFSLSTKNSKNLKFTFRSLYEPVQKIIIIADKIQAPPIN